MPINPERLARTFEALVRCDSVSRSEGHFAAQLQARLEALGVATQFDRSAPHTGSDTGNLIGRRAGATDKTPLLFSAHMDTVQPGVGIHPVFENGLFKSSGDTILGADDKSAIAILLEAIEVLNAAAQPLVPLEFVFSTCEEIGLLGAKHLDFDLLTARNGYVLDARDPDRLINRAPAANRLTLEVHGKEAHAGASPEKGINAIFIASRAIAALEWGRLDVETTCNIGMLHGGVATNIVPAQVTIDAEVRSHNETKLVRATRRIIDTFQDAVDTFSAYPAEGCKPRFAYDLKQDFKRTHIPEDHLVIQLAKDAALRLGRHLRCQPAGGGSDANVFFQKGITAGVLGTGMHDPHTRDERVALEDMVRACELVIEIVRLYSGLPAGRTKP